MQRLRMANLVLLGTCDTKLDEILYLRDEILRNKSIQVTLIDVGRREVQHNAIDIRTSGLLEQYGNGQSTTDLPRNEVIRLMAECATKAVKELYAVGDSFGHA
jgi:uncharacterized protein (UPF0261 family)